MYTKTIHECIGQRHPKYSSRGSQVPLRLNLDPAFSLSRSFSKSLNQFSSRTHFRYYPMHTHHTPTAVSAYVSLLLHAYNRPGNSMLPHLHLHINNFKSTCTMRVSSRIWTVFNKGHCTVEHCTQPHPNGRDLTLHREVYHSASHYGQENVELHLHSLIHIHGTMLKHSSLNKAKVKYKVILVQVIKIYRSEGISPLHINLATRRSDST